MTRPITELLSDYHLLSEERKQYLLGLAQETLVERLRTELGTALSSELRQFIELSQQPSPPVYSDSPEHYLV